MKRIILILLLFVGGCTPVREITRIDTIRVVPPVITDTITATVTDTVIIAQRITATDTVIDVRYYPREKLVTVKVKPDTITLIRVDTIRQDQPPVIVKNSLLENLGIALIGAAVLAVIIMIGKKWNQ